MNKIKDFDRQFALQPFSKCMADFATATYWVFSNDLPYKHIAGSLESGEYFALKLYQLKKPEVVKW